MLSSIFSLQQSTIAQPAGIGVLSHRLDRTHIRDLKDLCWRTRVRGRAQAAMRSTSTWADALTPIRSECIGLMVLFRRVSR
jgi:hypothetical protein